MIVKAESIKLIQKCVCGILSQHAYSGLAIKDSYIILPVCDECGSLEVLHQNDGVDEHSTMVTKVFAKVAIQGE